MAAQSSWSDLPGVILELIFDIIKDPVDIVRCGAACKSWLPTALQVYQKFLRLCLILIRKDEGNARVLFNLLTKETRMIQVPDAKEKWVCSVCNSCMFLVDSKFPHKIQLLNILSGTEIDLPSLTSEFEAILFSPTFDECRFECKLLLSKCPLNSDCIFFLLHDTYHAFHRISSWKPGQNNWSTIEIKYIRIYDAILYKGKLYALATDSTYRTVLVTYNYQLMIFQTLHCQFLVKSFDDDCLLVGVHDCGVKSIETFEFDVCTKELKKVNDLGGCAVFIGTNDFLAKAGDLETWFKANCIYFFRYWISKYRVYDLETRNFSDVPCHFDGKDQGKGFLGGLFLNFDV